ncbi:MAG: hypothetical protein LBH25_15205 [Fibromonadaceae bacterium]|nr:hypothetical protein [Fibromonadaceae bacterium]
MTFLEKDAIFTGINRTMESADETEISGNDACGGFFPYDWYHVLKVCEGGFYIK